MSSFDMVKEARTLREFMRLLTKASVKSWQTQGKDPLLAAYVYVIENFSGNEDLINSELFKSVKAANGNAISNIKILSARKADPNDLAYGRLTDDYEILAGCCGNFTYDTSEVVNRIKKIINKSDVPGKQILIELKLVVAYLG